MADDSARFLLGIDVGNTVIKAVLFDLDGRQVGSHAIDGQSSSPEPGHVERDLEELWRNASEALRRCVSEAGIDPGQIVALGLPAVRAIFDVTGAMTVGWLVGAVCLAPPTAGGRFDVGGYRCAQAASRTAPDWDFERSASTSRKR